MKSVGMHWYAPISHMLNNPRSNQYSFSISSRLMHIIFWMLNAKRFLTYALWGNLEFTVFYIYVCHCCHVPAIMDLLYLHTMFVWACCVICVLILGCLYRSWRLFCAVMKHAKCKGSKYAYFKSSRRELFISYPRPQNCSFTPEMAQNKWSTVFAETVFLCLFIIRAAGFTDRKRSSLTPCQQNSSVGVIIQNYSEFNHAFVFELFMFWIKSIVDFFFFFLEV